MSLHPAALLVFDGFFHPAWLARRNLERFFKNIPGWEFERASSLEHLLHLKPHSLQSIVLYFHHKRLTQPALDTLDQFVARGGGLVGIHSASASFKDQPRYFRILGGRFREHGPVREIEVYPSQEDDLLFFDITGFTVRDELYRHEYDPAVQIHFHATIDGEREPIVWTKRHGEGRVCYCSLGHTIRAMHNPHVLEILKRGLFWSAGEPSGGLLA
jgi:type 1 glutamine amidotransferase